MEESESGSRDIFFTHPCVRPSFFERSVTVRCRYIRSVCTTGFTDILKVFCRRRINVCSGVVSQLWRVWALFFRSKKCDRSFFCLSEMSTAFLFLEGFTLKFKLAARGEEYYSQLL
ncbi:unnamed protein product [Sphacelaria rigidula]